jgi:hypothetical protein
MIKLYYNTNGQGFYAHESIERNLPYIEVERTEFLKPMVNLETLELYEGATEEEINALILLDELTPKQFWDKVADLYGISDTQVVDIINSLPIDNLKKIKYLNAVRKSQVFERLDPLFNEIVPVLSQILNIEINVNQIFT